MRNAFIRLYRGMPAALLLCGLPMGSSADSAARPSLPASKPVSAPSTAKLLKKGDKTNAARPAPPVKAPAAPVEKTVTVDVRPNAEVNDKTFTLGEIATIQGDDKALIDQLAAVEIGASPLPGLSRIINAGEVTVHLRQHHLEIKRVEVTLPPGVRITRNAHEIANNDVTRAAIESARDAVKNLPGATLEAVPTALPVTVPIGKCRLVPGAWRGAVELGTLTVPVEIDVDGRPVQIVEVVLKIHRKVMTLIARHDIPIHTEITADDVVLALADLPASLTRPTLAMEDAIGMRSTRRIPADSAVGMDMLEKTPLINANDAITIEYIIGALRVTAAGRARQTGAAGDTIHVYATDTKKELDAVVIDKHTVRFADNIDQ